MTTVIGIKSKCKEPIRYLLFYITLHKVESQLRKQQELPVAIIDLKV